MKKLGLVVSAVALAGALVPVSAIALTANDEAHEGNSNTQAPPPSLQVQSDEISFINEDSDVVSNDLSLDNVQGFVDEDGDGVCDNQGQGNCYGYGCGNGQGFVDEDGDGVCDNRGQGNGYGHGYGHSNGQGNGRGCQR